MENVRKFIYEFEDTSHKNSITYDYETGDEVLSVRREDEESIISVNKSGCLVLAKLLLKFGLSDYKPGFHLHVYENFDAEKKTVLRLELVED